MDESGKLNRGCNKHHRSPTARFHFLFLLFPMFPLLTTATYILSPELLSRYRVSTACKRDPPLYLSPFWSITDLDPFPQANRNSFRERMLSFFFFFLDISFFSVSHSSIIPHPLKSRLKRIEPCSKKTRMRRRFQPNRPIPRKKRFHDPKRYYINRQSSSFSFLDSYWQVFKIFSLKIDSNLVRFRLCNTRLANMFLFNGLVVFSRVIIKNRALY